MANQLRSKNVSELAAVALLATLLGLGMAHPAAAAKPVCGNNMCEGNESKSCPEDCGGAAQPEGFSLVVTFDNEMDDTLVDDGDPSGDYTDGEQGVVAEMPLEGDPPGRLTVHTGKNRSVDVNFGELEDCSFENECFRDVDLDLVECPFKGIAVGEDCRALVQTSFFIKTVTAGGTSHYILDAPPGGPWTVESTGSSGEIQLRLGKNKDGQRLIRFHETGVDDICPAGSMDRLEVIVSDVFAAPNPIGGAQGADTWDISTGAESKVGCLIDPVRGGDPVALGLVEVRFGFSAQILP